MQQKGGQCNIEQKIRIVLVIVHRSEQLLQLHIIAAETAVYFMHQVCCMGMPKILPVADHIKVWIDHIAVSSWYA